VKRIAAAIGEGSVAVRLAFERLQPESTRQTVAEADLEEAWKRPAQIFLYK